MKYNTIGSSSSSSVSSEGRKSMLTLYTEPDFLNDKVSLSESELSSVRNELEIVQRALTLQTRRCRQLVAEYTRRLQEKEQQYQCEKMLRDDQLAKVLRALLIFEARLRQEQKYISHQLEEKDRIIKSQREHIHRLSSQYCKHCNQFYKNSESYGSSSEYVATDYHDSNFESLDSSSETYATSISTSDKTKDDDAEPKEESIKLYQKNKNKDSAKRGKRIGHRKSIGDYYEVLKLRSNNVSSCSDNTSNDYEHYESITSENITDTINVVSDRIETIFNSQTHQNLTEDNLDKHDQLIDHQDQSDNHENTVDIINKQKAEEEITNENDDREEPEEKSHSKINEDMPQVFDANEETNDNWYASASDPEDDTRNWNHTGNNPNFLECMNQILLQNINDNISSPPKSPNVRRKISNGGKRVKFSDEEEAKPEVKENKLRNVNELNAHNISDKMADYYEAPIQKTPNFYETPQSIYSNDYEQILSRSSTKSLPISLKSPTESHYYVDMDTKSEESLQIIRKSKISRTPPALPPKPANLLSKYRISKSPTKMSTPSIESEPDYCSISELNLPAMLATLNTNAKKLSVVAEINLTSNNGKLDNHVIVHSPKTSNTKNSHYDLDKNDLIVTSKPPEKVTVHEAKHTPIKTEVSSGSPIKKIETEILKLPQVTEIIIPEETDEPKKDERHISHDNYIKINSKIFKTKANTTKMPDSPTIRRPILIGSSVSSLISTFNNHQLMAEVQPKSPPRGKLNKKLFSSFENLQNLERQTSAKTPPTPDTPNFEFDLSQNFEEFKLDDCDIDEYNEPITPSEEGSEVKPQTSIAQDIESPREPKSPTKKLVNPEESNIETNSENINSGINEIDNANLLKTKNVNQPNYETFLECTGLSSKSILTPTRLLSNHKNILKPKDVKYRSMTKGNNFERRGSTIKYWSEPYI